MWASERQCECGPATVLSDEIDVYGIWTSRIGVQMFPQARSNETNTEAFFFFWKSRFQSTTESPEDYVYEASGNKV